MASNEDDCLVVDWTTESFHNGEIQLKLLLSNHEKINFESLKF